VRPVTNFTSTRVEFENSGRCCFESSFVDCLSKLLSKTYRFFSLQLKEKDVRNVSNNYAYSANHQSVNQPALSRYPKLFQLNYLSICMCYCACQRFVQAGAIVTSSEAVLLQLVADKDHPAFKDIQRLIRVSAPISGLVPMASTPTDSL